jgi:putative transposase
MVRKRHSDDYILKLLREIEVKLSNGSDVPSACRGVGISDATYYNWRKRFGRYG